MKAKQNFIAAESFMFGFKTELKDVKQIEPRKEGDEYKISFTNDGKKFSATFKEDGGILIEAPGRKFTTMDVRIFNGIVSHEVTQIVIKKKRAKMKDYMRHGALRY